MMFVKGHGLLAQSVLLLIGSSVASDDVDIMQLNLQNDHKAPTKPATTQATTPFQVEYFTFDRKAGNIPSGCPFDAANIGKKVDDSCCAAPLQSAGPVNAGFVKNGVYHNCAPLDQTAAIGGWIRGFLGCVDNAPTFGEVCIPEGASFGAGYPMNASFAATSWENTADSQECRCSAAGLASTYKGTGCFVAISPYMLGVTSYSIAFFAKITGSCGGTPNQVSPTDQVIELCMGNEMLQDMTPEARRCFCSDTFGVTVPGCDMDKAMDEAATIASNATNGTA